jgi:hypothetical protein
LAAAPLFALAALILLFFVRPPAGEFTARGGGSTNVADRWVSLEVFRTRTGEPGYQQVEGDLARGDALLFSVTNRPESPYRFAMILAFDEEGEIFWYYPAYTDQATNPTSIPIPASARPQPLDEAVRHGLHPGWLRVVGLFSEEPLDVHGVERVVEEALRDDGPTQLTRLPIAGTGQHTFLLRVEAP